MTTTATPTTGSRRRRAELGRFLKAHRARLRPEDVGLPPGGRRRTAGLRREEVALLASVGITWYTWLEQGRAINASAQVLDAVARTLRLDPTECEHLHQLAHGAPGRPVVTSTVAPPAVEEVLRSVDPLPAVLINGRYDVVAENGASEDLFRDWHSEPCLRYNHLWCCVTEPRARERLLNYDEAVRHLVARLRSEYGRHVGEPQWEECIRRLHEVSPEFAELWARHEVAEPTAPLRRFVHPSAGALNMVCTELAVSAAPDLRMIVYTPYDETTRRHLPLTRRREAAPSRPTQVPER